MAYENFDAGPLIEKLRRLGVDLQREAQARIEAAAMQAYTRVTGQYPVRSGNLRAGLTWGRGLARSGGGVLYGASGVLGAYVRNSAPHAWLYDHGTKPRRTSRQAERGQMWGKHPSGPPHTFIRAAIEARAAMYADLQALVDRVGARV